MANGTENRSGTERRADAVTHETLLVKLIEHDEVITGMAADIKDIKNKIIPLTAGIRALGWLGKAFLAIGALAIAGSAVLILWDKIMAKIAGE